MFDSFFSIYYKSLGANSLLIGVAAAAYQTAKITLGPSIGKFADQHGYHKLIATGICLYMLTGLAFVFAYNVHFIILLRLFQGVASAAFRAPIYSFLNSKTDKNNQSETLGTFDISFYSAIAIAPIAGGFLKQHTGISGVLILIIISCAAALLICLSIKNRIKPAVPISISETSSYEYTKTELAMYVFIFGKACALSCFIIYFPIYLTDGGIDSLNTGFALSCSAVGMCLFIRPMGKLSDRVPKSFMVLAGGVLYSILFICLPDNISPINASLFSLLCGVLGAVSQPAGLSLMMQNTNSNKNAYILSKFNSTMGIGFIIGAATSSLIIAHFSIQAAFTILGFISLLSTLLFFLIIKYEHSYISSFFRN